MMMMRMRQPGFHISVQGADESGKPFDRPREQHQVFYFLPNLPQRQPPQLEVQLSKYQTTETESFFYQNPPQLTRI